MKKLMSLLALMMLTISVLAVNISNSSNGIQISKADGWNEALYVEWAPFSDASSFAVYVKGGQYSDYTKIDEQLIRSYGTYNRADALGLKEGSYAVKVVPVLNGSEDASKASEATGIVVKKFNRDGYAHYNAVAGVGAYNDDGTLKNGARVIYVSKDNAKTIQLSMNVGKNEETRTGIQDILQAYEKGTETRPLAIRIIGQLKAADMPELGSSAIGLQVKGKGQKMNLTIEGVGNDATFHGFGVLCRACQYVELRNFAVMMHPEDGISFDTDNEHIWGHHIDIFYGQNKGGDKAKGDGSFDVKGTLYATVSDNHFWDSGKCNLNSNGDEVDFVTYHHNWYDHSDSRHPRVRLSKHLHVFNNYYDGNAKYGIGSTTGSCIFSENNYFRNCKYPMLISRQGSDVHNGVGSSDDTKGTFSKEDGGIIKAFGNYMTGQTSFEPYKAGDALYGTHFDAYVAQSRDEKVPADVKTLQGGTGYNNFDTESSFYTYTPDAAADVPAVVTGQYGAGRCQKGDFQWTFDNATEDKNYEVISSLSNALNAYTGKLVSIYGDMGKTTEDPNPVDPTPDDPTPDDPTPGPTPGDNASICHFTGNTPSSSQVTVTGNYANGKGTVTYGGTTYDICVKMESATEIKVTPATSGDITLVFGGSTGASGKKVKVDGTNQVIASDGTYTFAGTAGTKYTITKGDAINLFLIVFANGGGETPTPGPGPDDPTPGPTPDDPTPSGTGIYNWNTNVGSTTFITEGQADGIAKSTVKVNNTATDCITFSKSAAQQDPNTENAIITDFYATIKPASGGFKAGDVIRITGCINNSDASKKGAISFYANTAVSSLIATTEDFANTNSASVNPTEQTFTLAADCDEILLARSGNTKTCILKLSIERAGGETPTPGPGPDDPTPGPDDPTPGPSTDTDKVYDWSGKVGTITMATAGQADGVSESTVKVNNASVNCIKFGKSAAYADEAKTTISDFYAAIKPANGTFKAGDVIHITGCINNKDTETKKGAITVYSSLQEADKVATTEDFANTYDTSVNPVEQTIKLTADCESLILTRSGNTATCILALTVVRGEASGETAISIVEAAKVQKPQKRVENGRIIIVKGDNTFNASGARIK
ncbi:MAG: hypothetical protein IKP84_03660 [Prevotella sp.]|nr:hypothetical protein [Prevotella sp.]